MREIKPYNLLLQIPRKWKEKLKKPLFAVNFFKNHFLQLNWVNLSFKKKKNYIPIYLYFDSDDCQCELKIMRAKDFPIKNKKCKHWNYFVKYKFIN